MTHYVISATPPAEVGSISLSASHADIGDELTITGSGFGASQGTSTVTFGEALVTTPSPTGDVDWAPCTKPAASYVSWSDTEIVVTVPSMAPGVSGYPNTYHNVRVYVGGVESSPADFYIDPVTVNPSATSDIAWSTTGSPYSWQTVTRTANDDTTGGVQGYDYVAGNTAWLGCYVRGSNLLFQNCTFTCANAEIHGDYGGVVTLGQGEHNSNITFVNCTFKENWSTNELGTWHGVNGVKVVNYVHDVTIADSTFEPFSRMSWEAIDWSDSNPITYQAIKGCTFEPPGNQALSFGTSGILYALIEDCTFKGWGNHADLYPTGSACWETNTARYIVTRSCEFWTGAAGCININQSSSAVACHLYFEGVSIYADSAHHYQSRDYMYAASAMFECNRMSYARFKDCTFVTGDATLYNNNFGPCSWGSGAVGWALDCTYNDFTGSTVSGYVSWDGLQVPDTVEGYFRGSDDNPVLASNTLPALA